MRFLYVKPAVLPTLFVDRSFRELFQILYLAKKYLIDSLVSKMTELIGEKEIPDDKIMETANVAEEYPHFGRVSSALLQRAANSLVRVVTDLRSLKKFQSKLDPEDGDLFLKMIGLIQDRHIAPLVSCAAQPQCKKVPAASYCSAHLPRCVNGCGGSSSCQRPPTGTVCDEHKFPANIPSMPRMGGRPSGHGRL